MKLNFLPVLAAIVVMTLSVGCYTTVDGKRHVGTPYAKDFFESRYERPAAQVFAAAKEVLAFNGTLTDENTIKNTLSARVDKTVVAVKIDEVEPGISRVVVQARARGTGDLDLANEIDKQIALKLQAQQ